MSLRKRLAHYQTLFTQGVDLFLLRGQILQLDLQQQVNRLISLLIAVLLGTVFLLVGLLAALFGLNEILPPEMKIKVFFGTAAVLVLLAAIVVYRAISAWKQQSQVVQNTISEMRRDWAYLRGEITNSELAINSHKGEQNDSRTRT